MNGTINLNETEKLCDQIMNSPYFRKQTPAELKQLQAVLAKVSLLVNENVPSLIAEVKQLRNQNKRLRAEVAALDSSDQLSETNLSA